FREGARLLEERGVDWYVSIDGDELVHALPSAPEVLAQVPPQVQLVRALPCEAVHVHGAGGAGPFRARYFKLRQRGRRRLLSRIFYGDLRRVTQDNFF